MAVWKARRGSLNEEVDLEDGIMEGKGGEV